VTYEVLGQQAMQFLAGLERARPRSAAYHARHILALRQRYDTEDLVAALVHASDFGAYEHHAVETILQARAQTRRLGEYVAETTLARVQKTLQESQTEPRALSEYDELPCWSPATVEAEAVPGQTGEQTHGDEKEPPLDKKTNHDQAPE